MAAPEMDVRSRACSRARVRSAQAKIETIDVPEPAAGEVRIRIAASGVCGSDGHVLRGASTAVLAALRALARGRRDFAGSRSVPASTPSASATT